MQITKTRNRMAKDDCQTNEIQYLLYIQYLFYIQYLLYILFVYRDCITWCFVFIWGKGNNTQKTKLQPE